MRNAIRLTPLGLLGLLAACHGPAKPAATAPSLGVVRFNVDPGFVQGLADERHALPLSEWPLYQNTNLPVVRPTAQLTDHPASGKDLSLYRVAIMTVEGLRTYVFYHEDSKTLVLVQIR